MRYDGSSKWSNVPGCVCVEIGEIDGQWHTTSGVLMPLSFRKLIDEPEREAGDELIIRFESTGYYQPMSMYGGPDHVGWPEEGDDERTVVEAEIGIVKITNKECLADLQQMFEGQIADAELEEVE